MNKSKLTPNEICMIQKLAGNTQGEQYHAVNQISAFIKCKSIPGCPLFDDDGYLALWKGLFYCMYNSDKPLIQEKLAENISEMIHSFSTFKEKRLFFKAAMETFVREFDELDLYRADKYYDLFTVVLRQMLVCLRKKRWNRVLVRKIVDIIEKIIFGTEDDDCESPMNLKCYMTDILMLEVAKIGGSEMKYSTVKEFLMPFLKILVLSKDWKFVIHVKTAIIEWIIDQSGEKFVSEDYFDNNGQLMADKLDLRGGGQNVEIPQLNIKLRNISKTLKEMAESNANRKRKNFIFKICNDLKTGVDRDIEYIKKHKDMIHEQLEKDRLSMRRKMRRKKIVCWNLKNLE